MDIPHYLKVKPLTKKNRPQLYERVLMWRDDCGYWEKHYLSVDNEHWLDNPDFAYTHWIELPPPPEKEHVHIQYR